MFDCKSYPLSSRILQAVDVDSADSNESMVSWEVFSELYALLMTNWLSRDRHVKFWLKFLNPDNDHMIPLNKFSNSLALLEDDPNQIISEDQDNQLSIVDNVFEILLRGHCIVDQREVNILQLKRLLYGHDSLCRVLISTINPKYGY